jgi:hypothetical protein
MKTVLAAFIAVSLVTGIVDPAAAEPGYTEKKTYAKKRWRKPVSREPEAGTYYERDANRLPYGTRTWWEQMDREGRGGQSGNGGGFR